MALAGIAHAQELVADKNQTGTGIQAQCLKLGSTDRQKAGRTSDSSGTNSAAGASLTSQLADGVPATQRRPLPRLR